MSNPADMSPFAQQDTGGSPVDMSKFASASGSPEQGANQANHIMGNDGMARTDRFVRGNPRVGSNDPADTPPPRGDAAELRKLEKVTDRPSPRSRLRALDNVGMGEDGIPRSGKWYGNPQKQKDFQGPPVGARGMVTALKQARERYEGSQLNSNQGMDESGFAGLTPEDFDLPQVADGEGDIPMQEPPTTASPMPTPTKYSTALQQGATSSPYMQQPQSPITQAITILRQKLGL